MWSVEVHLKKIKDIHYRSAFDSNEAKLLGGTALAATAAVGAFVTMRALEDENYALIMNSMLLPDGQKGEGAWDQLRTGIETYTDAMGYPPTDLVFTGGDLMKLGSRGIEDPFYLVQQDVAGFGAMLKGLGLEDTVLHFRNYGFTYGEHGLRLLEDVAKETGMVVHASVDMKPEHDLKNVFTAIFGRRPPVEIVTTESTGLDTPGTADTPPGQDVWIAPDGHLLAQEMLIPIRPPDESIGASVLLTDKEVFTPKEVFQIALSAWKNNLEPYTSSYEAQEIIDITFAGTPVLPVLVPDKDAGLSRQEIGDLVLNGANEHGGQHGSIVAKMGFAPDVGQEYSLDSIKKQLIRDHGGGFSYSTMDGRTEETLLDPDMFSRNDIFYVTASGHMPPWYYRFVNYIEDHRSWWSDEATQFEDLYKKVDADSDGRVSQSEISTWWDGIAPS